MQSIRLLLRLVLTALRVIIAENLDQQPPTPEELTILSEHPQHEGVIALAQYIWDHDLENAFMNLFAHLLRERLTQHQDEQGLAELKALGFSRPDPAAVNLLNVANEEIDEYSDVPSALKHLKAALPVNDKMARKLETLGLLFRADAAADEGDDEAAMGFLLRAQAAKKST